MRRASFHVSLIMSLSCFAQQNTIGFTGGPTISRLHGNNIFKDVNSITTHQFGISYARWFKNGLGLHVQPTYMRTGTSVDYIGLLANGEETYRDEIRYVFDHLGLGVGASYRTPGRAYAMVSLGGMPAWIFSAQVRAPTPFNQPPGVVVTDLTSKVKNPVLIGYGAFGGTVDLKAPITIGLLFRYDHSLSTLSRSDFFESEDLRLSAWSAYLSASYRWARRLPELTVPAAL